MSGAGSTCFQQQNKNNQTHASAPEAQLILRQPQHCQPCFAAAHAPAAAAAVASALLQLCLLPICQPLNCCLAVGCSQCKLQFLGCLCGCAALDCLCRLF